MSGAMQPGGQQQDQRHWHSLDSLRGIAALLVLTFHCAQLSAGFASHVSPFSPKAWLEPWTWLKLTPLRLLVSSGPPAVVLFFVLSGFVLTLPFLRNGVRPGYAEFSIKRICRIYPPFAAAVLLSAALYAIVQPSPIPGASEWFDTVLWDQPLSGDYVARNLLMTGLRPDMTLDLVMWSLVHELRISLVFPLLLLLTRRYPRNATGLSLVAALVCTRALAGHEAETLAASLVDTMRFVPMFVAGIIIASNVASLRRNLARLSGPVRTGLWIGAFLLLMFPGQSVSDYYDFVWGAGAVLLLVLTIGSGVAERVLSVAPLRWLGRVSYSLYLVHVPLLVATVYLTHRWMPLWLVPVCVIPMSLAAAEVAYRTVEAPSIRLGRRLAGLVRARPQAAAAPRPALASPAADGPR